MSNCVLMDGKALSAKIRNQIKTEVGFIKDNIGFVPGLAVVLVGHDPASEIYVRNKEKACAEVGMTSKKIELPEDISEEELLSVIDSLNGGLVLFVCGVFSLIVMYFGLRYYKKDRGVIDEN